ncbi:MAG: hypothetical protein H7222_14545 [Methylotenera sp.]|nr:hypothetical protein [Oligoflexia bacterium]
MRTSALLVSGLRSSFSFGCVFVLGVLTSPRLLAVADVDLACTHEDPLVSAEWNSLDPVNDFKTPMKWSLPRFAGSTVMTDALFHFELSRGSSEQDWEAQFVVDFEDPTRLGVPFSFQHVALEWTDHSGRQINALDWSLACTGVGRSVYPGHILKFSVPMPGTHEMSRIDMPKLRLWGTRN